MYITLELAIGFYILVKMYCVYDDQYNFNLKVLGAWACMLASSASIIVSVIKAAFVLFK
jgi:hypothetical protein